MTPHLTPMPSQSAPQSYGPTSHTTQDGLDKRHTGTFGTVMQALAASLEPRDAGDDAGKIAQDQVAIDEARKGEGSLSTANPPDISPSTRDIGAKPVDFDTADMAGDVAGADKPASQADTAHSQDVHTQDDEHSALSGAGPRDEDANRPGAAADASKSFAQDLLQDRSAANTGTGSQTAQLDANQTQLAESAANTGVGARHVDADGAQMIAKSTDRALPPANPVIAPTFYGQNSQNSGHLAEDPTRMSHDQMAIPRSPLFAQYAGQADGGSSAAKNLSVQGLDAAPPRRDLTDASDNASRRSGEPMTNAYTLGPITGSDRARTHTLSAAAQTTLAHTQALQTARKQTDEASMRDGKIDIGDKPIVQASLQTQPGAIPRAGGALSVQNGAILHAAPTRIDAMAISLSQGNGTMEVTLKPEELGRLSLKLETTGTATQVLITAERADTQELARRHLDMLQDQLKNMGFENLSFAFSKHGQNAQGTHEPAAPSDAAPPGTAPEGTQTLWVRTSETGLDIKV